MPASPFDCQIVRVAPNLRARVENADRYPSVSPIRSDDPTRGLASRVAHISLQVRVPIDSIITVSSATDSNMS